MRADIKLIHGDCMEALPKMEDNQYGLAIVDVPYGIDFAKTHTGNGWIVRGSEDWDKQIPRHLHPTEKPVQLYKWILQNYAKQGDKIIDTHLGSGSICIACWDLCFDLIAFEKGKNHFDNAVKRLETHKSQGQLF